MNKQVVDVDGFSVCFINVSIHETCKDPIHIVNDMRKYDSVVVIYADLVTANGDGTVIVDNDKKPLATIICDFGEIDYIAKIYKCTSAGIFHEIYNRMTSISEET